MADTVLKLEGKVGVGELERLLSSQRRLLSQRRKSLRIDLSDLAWIGQPAACHLTAALASLRISSPSRDITIARSPSAHWGPQPRKALVDSGLLDIARNYGVVVEFPATRSSFRGLPATHLTEHMDVAELVEHAVLGEPVLAPARVRVQQLARQALPELAENSAIHSEASTPGWLVVGIAEAAGTGETNAGMLTSFRAGTTYVEATISDLGIGIVDSLRATVTNDRKGRIHGKAGLSDSERILAIALDPFSTRDAEARTRRITELLVGIGEVAAHSITTGLFQVLELCRQSAGELILRTRDAILLLRYRHPHAALPDVVNSGALGLRSLFSIAGTHITVRLPLLSNYRIAAPRATPPQTGRLRARVIAPTDMLDESLSEGHFLGQALDAINAYAARLSQGDALLITGAGSRLSARGRALFAHSLKNAYGPSIVLWDEPAAAPTAYPIPAVDQTGSGAQSVFVGDLSANAFVGLQEGSLPASLRVRASTGEVSLDPQLARSLRNERTIAVRGLLERYVQSPAVLKRGRFAFPHYYTAEFFEIAEATRSPFATEVLAEWLFESLPTFVSDSVNLVCHAAPMITVAHQLRELVAKRLRVSVTLVPPPTSPSQYQYISALLSLDRVPTIVVTDVIVSGASLTETLSNLADHPLVGLLAIVDGRILPSGTPMQITKAGSSSRAVGVVSVVQHPVVQYPASDLIPHENRGRSGSLAELDEEDAVAVVDPATRRPTVHSRPRHRPSIDFGSLSDERLLGSRAVIARHVSHRDKHYGYYLMLPALLTDLRPELREWLGGVEKRTAIEAGTDAPWRVQVHDPEGAFPGLRDLLAPFAMDKTPELLNADKLAAPPSFASNDEPPSRVLLVLGAVSSGAVLRRAVEYASRGRPEAIEVVVAFSRMSLEEFAFLSNITRYRGIKVHLNRFADFPVDTYAPGPARCPYCAMEVEWDRLSRTLKEVTGTKPIVNLIEQKRNSIRAVSIDSLQDASELLAATPADITRARTRALLGSTRSAQRGVVENSFADHVLQTIAAESESPAFAPERLQATFGEAFYIAIRDRFRYLLEYEEPPYPIGRVVGAAELLGPGLLIDSAAGLLERFGHVTRDREEICLALLRVRAKPSALRDTSLTLRSQGLDDAVDLIDATRQALEYLSADPASGSDRSLLKVLAGLAIAFQRTHMFHNLCESLPAYANEDSGRTWRELQEDVRALSDAWAGDIAIRLESLRENYAWYHLQRTHPNLIRIGDFEGAISDLERTAGFEPGARDSESSLRGNLRNYAIRIVELSLSAHRDIESLYCAPSQIASLHLGDSLTALSGATIEVDSTGVDARVGEAFIPRPLLEQVVAEAVLNLKKHAPGQPGLKCMVSMVEEEHHIVIRFADNFGGSFDMASPRGLAMIQNTLRSHCGEVEGTECGENGWKQLVLRVCRPYRGKL